jgi:ADP-ribosylglycohydrolase
MRGAFLGLAVGDALGAAIEFRRPGDFEPVTGYRGGGPWGLEAGEWTDDTTMALAMADSINTVGWCLDDQARHYLLWFDEGKYSVNGECFDIGGTTRAGLVTFRVSQSACTSGSSSPKASGNGSIMRLAPAAIHASRHFPHDIPRLARMAGDSSRPTHGSNQCVSACQYMALLMAGLLHGVDRDLVLAADWEPLQELRRAVDLNHRIDAIADGSFREKEPPEIRGTGWVVDSLEAALWAFHQAANFQEAVLDAVNLGDDADTTGAVCGQLAGACWGEEGIPGEWLEGLARRDEMIEPIVDRLVD